MPAAPAQLAIETRHASLDSLAERELRPLATRIDLDGYYPEAFLRKLGEAGAYTHHTDILNPNFPRAIQAIASIGRYCGSTAFLMWCHSACAWYLRQSENIALRAHWLPRLANGTQLGATALSNPMKNASGFEELKLRGQRVPGGYRVNGQLPWVSNLGPQAVCALVFQVEDHSVMALVETETVTRKPTAKFAALEGTATYALNFSEIFVPDENVLASPAAPFLKIVRPGFILLQTGIALGVIRGALDDIQKADKALAHANIFLPDRAEDLAAQAEVLEEEIFLAAEAVPTRGSEIFPEVVRLRLAVAQLALRTAESALWHTGAKGFLLNSSPQRRIREALFVNLLTPSVKHLRKELLRVD